MRATTALSCLLALLLSLAAVRSIALRLICRHCYRIGNAIDYWYADATGTMALAPSERAAHVVSPDFIFTGIRRRRVLDFRSSRQPLFLEKLASTPPTVLPPRDVARSSLRNGAGFHTSYDYRIVSQLLPYIQPSLREAVDGFRPGVGPTAPSQAVCPAHASNRTCVVHLRVGDLATARAPLPESLVRAAATFEPRPLCFVLLGGGAAHRCTQGQVAREGERVESDCGAARHRQLRRGLRAAFPHAAVVQMPRPSGESSASPSSELEAADEDFLWAVRAPFLLTGVGSFAMHAAIASRGQVRTPGCEMHYCEPATWRTEQLRLSPAWQTFDVRPPRPRITL